MDLRGSRAELSRQIVPGQIVLHEVECDVSYNRDQAVDPENCHARSPQVVSGGAESVKEQREYICGFDPHRAAEQQTIGS